MVFTDTASAKSAGFDIFGICTFTATTTATGSKATISGKVADSAGAQNPCIFELSGLPGTQGSATMISLINSLIL